MNKWKPTGTRIVTTTLALNHTMDIQRSIDKLKVKGQQSNREYVKGTAEDVEKLRNHIRKKLGEAKKVTPATKAFSCSTWSGAEDVPTRKTCISDLVEEAFGNVCDWVLKNKKMLVNNDGGEYEEVEVHDVEDDEKRKRKCKLTLQDALYLLITTTTTTTLLGTLNK